MNTRRTLTGIVLFLILLALPIAGRYLRFYTQPLEREPVVRPEVSKIEVPTPPSSTYADEVVVAGDGVVVVDMAHNNQIQMPELNVLAARLAARGHQFKDWTGGDLSHELRRASAFLVAVPLSSFEKDEIQAVQRFVESGGRLLLLGDPTRFGYLLDDWGWIVGVDSDSRYLSGLGAPFGIAYVDDYLYNVADNEGNFRNIKLSDWGESDLVDGLDTVVFYAAHSLAVADEAAVIYADDQTWSSANDRAGGLVVGAQTADGRVLALGDMTFMTEPYHTVRDNSEFIARVADFLTGAVRSYNLIDFPLFYGQEKVSLAFTNNPELGPGQLQLVDDLQEVFEETDQTLQLSEQPYTDTNALYLGLYSQPEPVSKYLEMYGISLTLTSTLELEEELADDVELDEDTADAEEAEESEAEKPAEEEEEFDPEGYVSIEGLGTYDMSGIVLLLLHEGDGYRALVVLSASQEGLNNVVDTLPDGELYDCVTAEAITLCPSGVPFEAIELEWEPEEVEEDEGDVELDTGDEDQGEQEIQGVLDYGDSVTEELAADEEHSWQFSGAAGDAVDIVATSDDLDLVLALDDPDGEELTSVDGSGSGFDESLINYSLPETGDYTIRVREYWGEVGEYTLSVDLSSGESGGEAAGGVIGFGETVEGELGEDETVTWTFDGAADQALTIIVQPNTEEGDLILRLQDEDGDTLAESDDTFSGDEERIEGVLPQDGEYRIQVSEWYGDPVSYTLSLIEGGEGPVFGGRGILVVAADDGEPLLDGETSADVYVDVLGSDYDVTLWTLSTDGELEVEDMQDYQLVIWSSGDFQGDEATQLAPFLVMAEGKPLIMSGASLTLLSDGETEPLLDVEVAEGDSALLDGLTSGEIYELSQEIDALVFEYEDEEGTIPIFYRGPDSEPVGDVIAAAIEEEYDGLQLVLIGFPLYLLPEEVQSQLILNAVQWFGIEPELVG